MKAGRWRYSTSSQKRKNLDGLYPKSTVAEGTHLYTINGILALVLASFSARISIKLQTFWERMQESFNRLEEAKSSQD